jgi:6-phosphogluconolactonase
MVISFLAIASVMAIGQGTPGQQGGSSLLLYLGTYTNTTSKGIYVARLDTSTGALTEPSLAATTPNPSFLALHPSGRFLYTVNETDTFQGKPGGAVSGFAVERTSGALTPINQQSSVGGGPAHLVVDRTGANVLVANYGGGSVAVLPLGADGSLKPSSSFVQHTGSSVNPQRQKAPHAHAVTLDPDNRFAYVPDLGLDKVLIYRFTPATGSIAAGDPPFAAVKPGAGPRHIAFTPSGRFGYVINELDCTITTFARDASRGELTAVQTVSTLPPGLPVAEGFSTAEVLVHPSGRFLYGSNRGHDSLSVFSIDPKTGHLAFVQNESTRGRTPRAFNIAPGGAWLVAGNQRSDSLVVFRIDAQTGRLTPTSQTVALGAPVSIEFVP